MIAGCEQAYSCMRLVMELPSVNSPLVVQDL